MGKKSKIIKTLITLLFFCLLTSVSTGTENDSYFEELTTSPDFIAIRGTISVITENVEKEE